MVAAWMIYGGVFALLVAGAAVLGERALRVWRLQARAVWSGAIIISVLWPVVALIGAASGRRPVLLSPVLAVSEGAAVWDGVNTAADRLRTGAADLDTLLLVCWAAASIVALLVLARSLGESRGIRAASVEASIDGHSVLLSREHGPAVTGLAPSTIVVPRWVLALDPSLRELVLLHEREHAEGGDPWLMALGAIALVLMPWNVALWWQVRRLRLAVEVDCDERVLRARPDVQRYGSLLLAVTQRGTRSLAPLSTMLVERPSQLEVRLTAMTARMPARPMVTSGLLGGVAAAIALVACEAPVPSDVSSARSSGPVVARPAVQAANQAYFEFQVEQPVVQAEGSRGPRYPDILRSAGVEGEVLAQFVVDTAGRAEPGTLKILRANHDLFAESVKAALPEMRFVPARVGGRAVRQLVQQPFTYQIAGSATVREGVPVRPGAPR